MIIPVTPKFDSSMMITLGYKLVKELRDIPTVIVVLKSIFRKMGQLSLLVLRLMTIVWAWYKFIVTKTELGVNEVKTFWVNSRAIDLETI